MAAETLGTGSDRRRWAAMQNIGVPMSDIKDPRAAAARMRVAIQSLTAPHDIDVARRYIAELELVAREQEAEEARMQTPHGVLVSWG